MVQGEEDSTPVSGRVKWFDPAKGFGFVIADAPEQSGDILLHANVLRNFGQSSVADGAAISIRVQHTPRGVQATEVLSIQPPEPEDDVPPREGTTIDERLGEGRPLEPARVKWFDKAKGFGFANTFGRKEDIFLHLDVLRRAGLADLQPGEAVALRVVEGRRGRLAVQICTWESGLSDDAVLSDDPGDASTAGPDDLPDIAASEGPH